MVKDEIGSEQLEEFLGMSDIIKDPGKQIIRSYGWKLPRQEKPSIRAKSQLAGIFNLLFTLTWQNENCFSSCFCEKHVKSDAVAYPSCEKTLITSE